MGPSEITCTTRHQFPIIEHICRLTDNTTAGQTGQFGQTDMSFVTVVTNYLLFAPDDEAPWLPVFLKGEVQGYFQVNTASPAAYSVCYI